MPIDPSIPLGVQRARMPDRMQQMANVLAIKQAQQQGDLAAYQMDKARRDDARSAELRNALAETGGDYDKARAVLIGSGDVAGALSLDKSRAGIAKDEAAQKVSELKAIGERLGLGARILGTATDEASYQAGLAIAARELGPDSIKGAPANYDPAWVKQTTMRALEAKDAIAAQLNSDQFRETQRHNRATEANSAANAAAMSQYRADRLAQGDRANDIAAAGTNFKNEQAMADDFRAASKDFIAVRDAYKRVKTSLDTATKSAPATLAAATSFMKLLDPGSVVRESELGMALEASGAFDRAANYVNILQNGKVLTKQQVDDFRKISSQVYKAAESAQLQREDEFKRQAGRYQLDPRNIVGQGMTATEPSVPIDGAQQAPDGKWYVKGPDGKYLRVDP